MNSFLPYHKDLNLMLLIIRDEKWMILFGYKCVLVVGPTQFSKEFFKNYWSHAPLMIVLVIWNETQISSQTQCAFFFFFFYKIKGFQCSLLYMLIQTLKMWSFTLELVQQVKSSQFNRNPHKQEFCVRAKYFPMLISQWMQVHLYSPWPTESCMICKWLLCELCLMHRCAIDGGFSFVCEILLTWPNLSFSLLPQKIRHFEELIQLFSLQWQFILW